MIVGREISEADHMRRVIRKAEKKNYSCTRKEKHHIRMKISS